MYVIYVADDGTQFDDEGKCLDYEFIQKYQDGMRDITIFNHQGDAAKDLMAEETYFTSAVISVRSMAGVEAINAIGEITGYCAYQDIDSPGIWKYDDENDGSIYKEKEVE